jgi:hypothetical protein
LTRARSAQARATRCARNRIRGRAEGSWRACARNRQPDEYHQEAQRVRASSRPIVIGRASLTPDLRFVEERGQRSWFA